MKAMKRNDVERMLLASGFTLLRNSSHIVYGKGNVRVILSHSREVSPGMMRAVYKAIAA